MIRFTAMAWLIVSQHWSSMAYASCTIERAQKCPPVQAASDGVDSSLQASACGSSLKGAAFADTVYARRALRSMGDLDLLVRRQDVASGEHQLSVQFLHDEGSHSREWYTAHPPGVSASRRPHGSLHLEVHWHIGVRSARYSGIDRLWERAVPATVADVDVRVSPEDVLLHLCLHTCQDRFSFGLRPFSVTISAILCRADGAMDWDYVQQRA
jgi:hypothetical protein